MKMFFTFIILIFFSSVSFATSIVSDEYPSGTHQPTHCRLIFSEPALPDRVEPVEAMPGGAVRCKIPIDDLLTPGQRLTLEVAASAIDQLTGDESDLSPFFILNAVGGVTTPENIRMEY